MFAALDLNHQIQGGLLDVIEDNLVRLPGLYPGDVSPLNAGMDIRLQVAAGDRPAPGKAQDHKVASSEKEVPGGDDMLDEFRGHLQRQALGTSHIFLEEGIQAIFILPRVFLLFINDEGGVTEDSVADGFEHPLEGLDIGDFNQNFFLVFQGQFPDPIREIKVIFLQVFRVVVEDLAIPFFPQTHLVGDKFTMGSSVK